MSATVERLRATFSHTVSHANEAAWMEIEAALTEVAAELDRLTRERDEVTDLALKYVDHVARVSHGVVLSAAIHGVTISDEDSKHGALLVADLRRRKAEQP